MAQEQPRGAIPRPRPGSAAGRSYLTLQVRGGSREEQPHVQGQGRPGGAIPRPRSGATARRSYPTPEDRGRGWEKQPHIQEQWLHGCKRAKRSYSAIKVRRGGGEEIPFIQGKEPRLRFAGAAVKRYPTSKVSETQVRW